MNAQLMKEIEDFITDFQKAKLDELCGKLNDEYPDLLFFCKDGNIYVKEEYTHCKVT